MFLVKNKCCYQYIPKNASSLLIKHFKELHWSEINSNQIEKDFTIMVVLRDPYERWISGFIEEIIGLNDENLSKKITSRIEEVDPWFLDWIFATKTCNVGWHTKLQKDWIDSSLNLQTVYFKMEENFTFKMHHWLLGEGIANRFNNLPVFNSKKHYSIYHKVNSYLMDAKNNKNKNVLLEYLQPDYDFINSVTFY